MIMLGWALIINNLGRRRYPLHWWAPGVTFFYDPEEDKDELRQMEEAEVEEEEEEEGALRVESNPGSPTESTRRPLEARRQRSSAASMEPASLESAVDSRPGEFQRLD